MIAQRRVHLAAHMRGEPRDAPVLDADPFRVRSRKAGEEAATGDVLVKSGVVLNPAHLARAGDETPAPMTMAPLTRAPATEVFMSVSWIQCVGDGINDRR